MSWLCSSWMVVKSREQSTLSTNDIICLIFFQSLNWIDWVLVEKKALPVNDALPFIHSFILFDNQS